MIKHTFHSCFASSIIELIKFKQSLGYKFETEQKILKQFDSFSIVKNLKSNKLVKELVDEFCSMRSNEAIATRNIRVSCLRNLARYLVSQGEEAYIYPPLPRGAYNRHYIPHIFTDEELRSIFIIADHNSTKNIKRGREYALILRLLYGSGMRVSEVVNLKVNNINFEKCYITVIQGKNKKDRIVPIHPNFLPEIKKYLEDKRYLYLPEAYCFNQHGKKYSTESVYRAFRSYIWQAKIPHGGKRKGPRLHDFRHTFCVHRLRDWIKDGKDITALFPYLCSYLGHVDTRGTEYYFQLTAEFYPEIIERSENYWNGVSNSEI